MPGWLIFLSAIQFLKLRNLGLGRWPELPEADVANLAQLAEQTQQPILMAMGLHIHRLWCTVEDIPRPAEVKVRGRDLAIRAYHLWRCAGRLDRADDEISFSGYQLNGRYSQQVAARYARRRSRTTPVVNAAQISLLKSKAARWWLSATESQRVGWLSRMLPRYFAAFNCSKPALANGSPAWYWVKDILMVSVLGNEGRRLMRQSEAPAHHVLNGPELLAMSGRRVRPLSVSTGRNLVDQYLTRLCFNLNEG